MVCVQSRHSHSESESERKIFMEKQNGKLNEFSVEKQSELLVLKFSGGVGCCFWGWQVVCKLNESDD